MKTQMTLTELAQELERRKAAKADYIVDSRLMHMTDAGKLLIDKDNPMLLPMERDINSVAHGQLAAKLDIPKKYYDRMLVEAPALLAQNVNNWFNQQPKTQLVRTLDNTARAFLSNRYRRIENEQIAEAVLPILMQEPNVEFHQMAITEQRLYIKAVFPRMQGEIAKGDMVQAGIVISNSEVGMGPWSIQPLIFRLVCLNGLILPDAKFAGRHVGGKIADEENIAALLTDETKEADDRALMLKIRDVTAAVFDQARFQQHIKGLQDLTAQKIEGNPVKAVEVLTKRMSLTESESGSLLSNLISGGDLSRWGVVNAITALGNDGTDFDRANQFQAFGGNVVNLTQNEWKEIAMAA